MTKCAGKRQGLRCPEAVGSQTAPATCADSAHPKKTRLYQTRTVNAEMGTQKRTRHCKQPPCTHMVLKATLFNGTLRNFSSYMARCGPTVKNNTKITRATASSNALRWPQEKAVHRLPLPVTTTMTEGYLDDVALHAHPNQHMLKPRWTQAQGMVTTQCQALNAYR